MVGLDHSHPNGDQLLAFSLGRLDDETAETSISAHLDTCAACQQTLERLSGDTLESLVRASDTVSASFAPAAKSPPFTNHPRYEIEELLGVGGMGAVYRARHKLMGREVALKVVKAQLVEKPGRVERFHREVQAAARLIHPNIVTAFDAEQVGDTHFLVMEFVPGQSLAQVIQERGKLPVALACEYVRQVAVGLQHAYEQGMVHRDIKPANLMVTSAGQVKILDFGLARLASELPGGVATQEGYVLGTPDYIAPEQAEDSRQADIRADVYSLGCTLYHLLTDEPPFPTGTFLQKIKAHQTQTPRPLTELRPDVPARLVAVVERMMAKDPDQRYQTPAEVAQALAQFEKASEPASTSPALAATTTEVVCPVAVRQMLPARWTPRKWLWIAAGFLFVLASGVLFPQLIIRLTDKKGNIREFPVKPDETIQIVQNPAASEKKTTTGLDRRAAEWVLSSGGKIQIRQDGQTRLIEAAKDLPAAPFEVVLVDLQNNQKVSDAGLEHLKGLTNLTELDLRETHVSDAGLEHVKGLSKLRVLMLKGTRVSDAGLMHLKGLSDLTELFLGHTGVKGDGLKHLEGLTNLTRISLEGTPVTDAGVVHLRGLINLTVLDLRDTAVSGAGLDYLTGLRKLRVFVLNGTRVSDAALAPLRWLTNLTQLDLGRTGVSGEGLKHLEGLTKLSDLRLNATAVTDSGMEHLKGLGNLTVLDLHGTAVSNAGLEHLKELGKLRVFVLNGTRVNDAGLMHLQGLTHLTELDLGQTRVSGAGLKHLEGLTKLSDLRLEATAATDSGVVHLKGLTNLTQLDLRETHVSDAGLEHLKGLNKLRFMCLNGTQVSNAGLVHLQGLTDLTELDLANTRVGDPGLRHLVGLSHLEHLDLTGTQITDRGLAEVRKALPRCEVFPKNSQ
jgi:serine/threonine protein kinase/Leucine-rich repeat (LRR) protein